MFEIVVGCSIVLGILGVVMTVFSLYVVRVNTRLEKRMKEKDDEILKNKEKIEERNARIKDQEKSLLMLREQINIRDTEIRSLKRKVTTYLNAIKL